MMESSHTEGFQARPSDHAPVPLRRFSPQLVETSSHRIGNTAREVPSPVGGTPQLRKVQPQRLETSTVLTESSHPVEDPLSESGRSPLADGADQAFTAKSAPVRRKFAPQLVGTTSRRRRSTDSHPCIQAEDKTDFSHGDHGTLRKCVERSTGTLSATSTSIGIDDRHAQVFESHFSSEAIGRRKPRQHSFRVPELPAIRSTIEESESPDKSKVPSLSTSPSADSNGPEVEKQGLIDLPPEESRTRPGDLVSFAAQSAEKQLRERVMAAYPNEHDNERVRHFAAESSLSDSDDAERQSTYGEEKPLPHRRSNHVHFDGSKHVRDGSVQDQPEGAQRRRSRLNSVAREHERLRAHATASQGVAKDREMSVMRKAASPPMAGEGLQFRRCQSPRSTRLDCPNYPGAVKKATQSRHSPARGGLWGVTDQPPRRNSPTGLWNGVCSPQIQKGNLNKAPLQNGILTPPLIDHQNPMDQVTPTSSNLSVPPTPPSSHEPSCPASLTSILVTEEAIDREYPDDFVTVVYDYCSFGYPSLARRYDEELSKVTHIPIEQIRRDDDDQNPRGHIGVQYGILEGFSDDKSVRRNCDPVPAFDQRWKALRLYIREWARQSPRMLGQSGKREWGESSRKGSWAI